MTENYIFNTCIYKHIRRNFACISSAFLKIHILSTNLDIGSFCSLYNRYNVDSRYTEYYINFLVRNERLQLFYKCYCLAWSLIHFPVSCNNFFSCHCSISFSILQGYSPYHACPLHTPVLIRYGECDPCLDSFFAYAHFSQVIIYHLLLQHPEVLFLQGTQVMHRHLLKYESSCHHIQADLQRLLNLHHR